MTQGYMIGTDIGTTSTKSVLFTLDGKVKAMHHVEYPLHSPIPAAAEQDPEEIFTAVVESIKQALLKSGVDPSEVKCVSFSAAMHSLIAVDGEGQPLTACITWADSRSARWADIIKREHNGQEIYMRTGTPIHPMSPLSKLLWLRHEHSDIFRKAAKFISIKEYVFYKLFGEYVVDHSIASATGLFNIHELDWDEGALKVAGVAPDKLSRLVPTRHIMNELKENWAEQMGLPANVPFVIGANDGVLSNLGVNAIEPGVVAVTIGTSGAIRTVTDRPRVDPKGRIFCYVLTEDKWVIGGPVNNGGMVFRWVRDQIATMEKETALSEGRDPYELLTEIAAGVKPGSDGLIFHPYLAGERAPLWDSNARGSYFGLGLHHKKEHLIRAAMEGVILNLYTVFMALQELIGQPGKIQATGGFARSELWRQMMADIFSQEVHVPESVESSCLGAAILGLNAIGEADSLDVVSNMIGSTHRHTPNLENTDIYAEITRIYIRISRLLQPEYKSITDFQNKWV
ncbi:gluconate kinase, FGGY family [Paenibacillaceae bacterium GAS479]|nr:gluconate kinase, FGGY family [Paenibacillaceae bacterium GAS479]